MFGLFERLLKPTDMPEHPEPPPGLIGFYWHFARQAKGLLVGLFAAGFVVALLDSLIPVFIGRIVTLITSVQAAATRRGPLARARRHGGSCCWCCGRLRSRPRTSWPTRRSRRTSRNMIRWQSHWHVVRQSWAFFQNDFAGRIANRVMQTGPAIRETSSRCSRRSGTSWCTAQRGDPARRRRPLAGAADPDLVRRLSGDAAHLRAAHARPLQGHVGGALDADRPHRRQLHQHPDGEAVRARARGRRLCARRGRRAHRHVPRLAAAQHAVRPDAVHAQRDDGDRHRRARDLSVDASARSRSAPSRWRCR